MKHLFFLSGYLHKSAGIAQNVAKTVGKHMPSKSVATTAGLGGLALGSGIDAVQTAKAKTEAAMSDKAVIKKKDDLRKKQNPHNKPKAEGTK